MKFKYRINLQLFSSEEKTEKPTPKKRKEAREKGQVLQSKEINSALILIFTFLALRIFGKYMYENLIMFTTSMFTQYGQMVDLFTIKGISNLFLKMILVTVMVSGPIIAMAFIIGGASSLVQVGFLFTTKTLEFKLSRLNPIEGFKRIFSKKSIVELAKSMIKIVVVGYVVYSYMIKQFPSIINLTGMSINVTVKAIGQNAFNIAIRAGGVLVVLAAFDYLYQWWDHEKNLKMGKQEIKQEYKQTEGNPQIKSKIKEKQRQIAMRRMMQDVPKADVIITNPTHFAVALKYERDRFDAPYVIAKGQDLIAQNIKKIGANNLVPIVENKPLAQSLYKSSEIGDIIPEDLYQAVAEVLAYVYGLNNA